MTTMTNAEPMAVEADQWGLFDDGTIGMTLAYMQYGGTPLFTRLVAEHNQRIIDARTN